MFTYRQTLNKNLQTLNKNSKILEFRKSSRCTGIGTRSDENKRNCSQFNAKLVRPSPAMEKKQCCCFGSEPIIMLEMGRGS